MALNMVMDHSDSKRGNLLQLLPGIIIVVGAGFLFYYLSSTLPYVLCHITLFNIFHSEISFVLVLQTSCKSLKKNFVLYI